MLGRYDMKCFEFVSKPLTLCRGVPHAHRIFRSMDAPNRGPGPWRKYNRREPVRAGDRAFSGDGVTADVHVRS